MRCPNCDYDNVIGASYCAWCKKPVPATPKPLQQPAKEAPLPPKPPVPEVEAPPLPGARYYALIGALFAIIANWIFLIPWEREMHSRYAATLESTSILVAAIGYYYCKKIALARYPDKAVSAGARGGALIGTVNGTVVFPVIGTVIGAVLGTGIGALVAGPLAFYLIKFFRWMSLGWTDSNTDTERDEKADPVPVKAGTSETNVAAPRPNAIYLIWLGVIASVLFNRLLLTEIQPKLINAHVSMQHILIITTLLAGCASYYFGRKIALKPTYENVLFYGLSGGAIVGAINGVIVIPLKDFISVLITIIAGMLSGLLVALLLVILVRLQWRRLGFTDSSQNT